MTREKIFLSCVSRQFAHCRDALAKDLRATGFDVATQEEFARHPRRALPLQKLQAYSAGCNRVIALVRDIYGAEPAAAEFTTEAARQSYLQGEYYLVET